MQKWINFKMYIRILFLVFTVLCVSAFNNSKTVSWQQIFVPTNHYKVYIDVNSIEKEQTNNGELTSGTILLIPAIPSNVLIDGKFVTIRSVVRYVAIKCATGASVPVIDAYFSIPTPSLTDTPVKVVDYMKTQQNAELLDKKSFTYLGLCPVFI